jgi:CRP-like cAMP-binding protein
MTSGHRAPINLFLSSLPAEELHRLRPFLKPVLLRRNAVLFKLGDHGGPIIFPCGGMVSVLAITGDGDAVEILTVGKEGYLGTISLLGLGSWPFELTATIGGPALQIQTEVFRTALKRAPILSERLMTYSAATFAQVAQRVACTAWHSVEARCAFRLLAAQDCIGSNVLPLTQETIARLVGVRRPGVTMVARTLQRMGLITQARGRITIIDRRGLEQVACECHSMICERYSHLSWYRPRPPEAREHEPRSLVALAPTFGTETSPPGTTQPINRAPEYKPDRR